MVGLIATNVTRHTRLEAGIRCGSLANQEIYKHMNFTNTFSSLYLFKALTLIKKMRLAFITLNQRI